MVACKKLTEHGRQRMRYWLYVMGPSMVTEIGGCGYDRVVRLTSPVFHACLAYISFTTLCCSSAVQVDQLAVFGHLQRSRGVRKPTTRCDAYTKAVIPL